MKKNFLLLLFFFCIAGLAACSPSLPPAGQLSKDELELKQLALQVAQLQQEQQTYVFTRVVTILGSILGSAAILWTILSGIQAIRNQATTQKQSRIAEILTALSSDKELDRLGAARSLTRYPDETVDEILSALRFEVSPAVREVLEETLECIDKRHIARLVNANAKTLEERMGLLGRLRSAGVESTSAKALLRLTDHAAVTLRRNHDFRFRYDHGYEYQEYEQSLQKQLEQAPDQAYADLGKICQWSANLAKSSCKVIARFLRLGHKPGRIARPLDLTASNLYRAKLPGAILSNSIFAWSVMRHIDLRKADLRGSDLSNCNLYGANLNGAELAEAALEGSTLVDVEAEGASFVNVAITKTDFSRANLRRANFKDCKGAEAKFKGITAVQVNFDGCELVSAYFDGTSLTGASFLAARLFRADLNGARLLDSNLHGAKLNGANLNAARFTGSDLQDVDLSGADLKRADFRGARNMDTVKFTGARNIETALFDPGFVPPAQTA